MMCQCEVEAILRTAGPNTTRPGKSFWTCAKPNGQSCGLFVSFTVASSANSRNGPTRTEVITLEPVQVALSQLDHTPSNQHQPKRLDLWYVP